MNELQPVGAPDVRLSIARASQATGVDFDYLLAQARLESSLNPNAKAGTSSAAGLYQFINSTWLNTLDRHGANHGLGWADAAISQGSKGAYISDPALRSQIMALRYDPDAASLMAAELARDNQGALRDTLGRDPDFAELYLAHFLGSNGASKFLSAMQQNPEGSAAAIFPKQAAANRPVFFNSSGSARSLGQVMDYFRNKLGNAMEAEGSSPPNFARLAMNAGMPLGMPVSPAIPSTERHVTPARPLGPLAQEFHNAAGNLPSTTGRVSMVETLQQTFGGTGEGAGALPQNVKAAYAKLKAFDL